MTPTATHNLNRKLGASTQRRSRNSSIGVSWTATAIHSSAPPVRIVGAASRYQGGYRVNV